MHLSRQGWYMPKISALGRKRQDDGIKFKASLVSIMIFSLTRVHGKTLSQKPETKKLLCIPIMKYHETYEKCIN